MTLIDHQILIPASQTKVWTTLSDLQQNPLWQANCQAVSVLTTMKSGPGTRWRSTTKSGREQVIEITAWYDRLGYEYRIVDGSSLQNNKGLFRLQEIPEGTILQWTLSYDPSGFLSGLRDSLQTRRKLDTEITDSLRQFYRLHSSRHNANAAATGNIETKSLMREAPDVEARASYQPRHPSNVEEAGAATSRPAGPAFRMNRDIARPSERQSIEPSFAETGFAEPAVEEGDTRPNVVVAQVTQPAAPLDTDAAFRPPVADLTSVQSQSQTQASTPITEEREQVILEPEVQPLETAPSFSAPEPEPETPAAETTPTATSVPTAATSIPHVSERPVLETFDDDVLGYVDTRELDTAKISVFELFGIPKPSDSQQLARVEPPQISESSEVLQPISIDPEVSTVPSNSMTGVSQPLQAVQPVVLDRDFIAALHAEPVGLRWLLRRQTVNVRRATIRK
jgi:uncharacterized membrane protein